MNFSPEIVGIGKYSGELASWLARNGHQVRVVASQPYFPDWVTPLNRYTREARDGSVVYRCPIFLPKRLSGFMRIIHLASFGLSSAPIVFLSLLRRTDVVICVIPSTIASFLTLFITNLSLSKAATWCHVQDLEIDAAFSLGILRSNTLRSLAFKIERSFLRGYDIISTINPPMKERLANKGLNSEKLYLFNNWLPDIADSKNDITPVGFRSSLGADQDTVIIMYSGSMNQKQGLIEFHNVIQLVELYGKVLWVFCGEGPLKTDLEKSMMNFSNVLFVSFKPDDELVPWLMCADIHILPQRQDVDDFAFPSKLMSMMASGRPVVAQTSEGSYLASIVAKCGFVVQPGDPISFANAVRRLINDRSLRKDLGVNGIELAERLFRKETILRKFENELQSLVEAKKV